MPTHIRTIYSNLLQRHAQARKIHLPLQSFSEIPSDSSVFVVDAVVSLVGPFPVDLEFFGVLFVQDIYYAIGVGVTRFRVLQMFRGSVIVVFQILQPPFESLQPGSMLFSLVFIFLETRSVWE